MDGVKGAHRSSIEYNVYWTIFNGSLLVLIVAGNVLTILAVTLSKRLRRVTSNMFILNLAISDLMVGLTLPYHLAFYVGTRLGEHETTCVLRFVVMSFACSASVYNVIIIAVDRYIAVIHPLKYSRYVTKLTGLLTIIVGWLHAIVVSTVPIYWNCYEVDLPCEWEIIYPRYYSVALVCPLIGLIWLGMFLLYWQIWKAASDHAHRIRDDGYDNRGLDDSKSLKVVLPILASFSVCWGPFLVVACVLVFHRHRPEAPTLYKTLFSLAMANSGVNPIIYAWKNAEFRKAFQNISHFTRPDRNDFNSNLREYRRNQGESMENPTGL